METSNFIEMGTFQLTDVIIKDYKTSFNGNLFVTVAKENAKNHFIGLILNALGGHDIVSMQRRYTHINIKGVIMKNPKTEKVLYIVTDDDAIQIVE